MPHYRVFLHETRSGVATIAAASEDDAYLAAEELLLRVGLDGFDTFHQTDADHGVADVEAA